MYQLSLEQIEFINEDIRRRGISMHSLQEDLLDHICCILENEYTEEQPFEVFYETVVQRFYQNQLWELEEETLLLITFKNYHTMKKVTLISGIAAATLLSTGVFFKYMWWPGAAMLILIGILLMAFVFLPMLFVLRMKNNFSTRDKIVTSSGTLLAMILSLHILFRIFHWPGSELLFNMTGYLLFAFIPLFFFSGYRNEQNRQNTMIITILMILGTGLIMTTLRTPASTRIKALNSSKVFEQSENLLKRERALVMEKNIGTLASGLNEKIYRQCQDLKSEMVKGGYIGEAKKNILMEASARDYFGKDEAVDVVLKPIFESFDQYNNQVADPSKKLFDKETLCELIHTEKMLTILCLLNQVQMQMLQDEKVLLAAVK